MTGLLENKVAVIYGAGGPIGGAVARAFAREGAKLFLAGRTGEKLERLADHERYAVALPDRPGRCAAHDPTRLRGDPGIWRGWAADAPRPGWF